MPNSCKCHRDKQSNRCTLKDPDKGIPIEHFRSRSQETQDRGRPPMIRFALPNTRAEAEPATVGCNPTTNLRRQLKPLIRNALRSFGLGSRSLRLSLIWKSFQLMDIPSESVPARQRKLHASSNGSLRKSDLSVRAQMNHLAQMRVRVRSKSRAHFMVSHVSDA